MSVKKLMKDYEEQASYINVVFTPKDGGENMEVNLHRVSEWNVTELIKVLIKAQADRKNMHVTECIKAIVIEMMFEDLER